MRITNDGYIGRRITNSILATATVHRFILSLHWT
jgi:hypothetical protein